MSVKENKFELLSAYLDGETLSDDQLLELMSDEECMSRWEVYTRQRATVRNEIPDGVDMDSFSESLSAKLDAEAVYINIGTGNDSALAGKAVNDELPEVKPAARNDFWGSLGRIAVAAAVACVCVFGAQRMPFVQKSDFNDDSVFSGGMAIEPVSNTVVSGDNNLSLDIGGANGVTDARRANSALVKADGVDGSQMEEYNRRKLAEMNTIEALFNDHDFTRRNIVQER